MDLDKFFQSKIFKYGALALIALFLIFGAFKAGTLVGFKKADFSFRWAENYHQNFAGPRGGFFQEFERGARGGDFINAHGVIGQIIKIDGSNIVIKGADNVEKIILAKENTAIMRFKDAIKITDLKIDENIVIIGEPNENGQIEAKLIRVAPARPEITPLNK